jgi:hypothetical protein
MDIAEWRQVVSDDWKRLRDAPSKVRGDRLAVLGAVRQSGWALAYAEPELRSDREIVLQAAQTSVREQASLQGNLHADSNARTTSMYHQSAPTILPDDYTYLVETAQWGASAIVFVAGSITESAVDRTSAALAGASDALESVSESLVERAAVVGEVVEALPSPSDTLANAGSALESASEGLVERAALFGEVVDRSHLLQKLLLAEDSPKPHNDAVPSQPIWRRTSRAHLSSVAGIRSTHRGSTAEEPHVSRRSAPRVRHSTH